MRGKRGSDLHNGYWTSICIWCHTLRAYWAWLSKNSHGRERKILTTGCISQQPEKHSGVHTHKTGFLFCWHFVSVFLFSFLFSPGVAKKEMLLDDEFGSWFPNVLGPFKFFQNLCKRSKITRYVRGIFYPSFSKEMVNLFQVY